MSFIPWACLGFFIFSIVMMVAMNAACWSRIRMVKEKSDKHERAAVYWENEANRWQALAEKNASAVRASATWESAAKEWEKSYASLQHELKESQARVRSMQTRLRAMLDESK